MTCNGCVGTPPTARYEGLRVSCRYNYCLSCCLLTLTASTSQLHLVCRIASISDEDKLLGMKRKVERDRSVVSKMVIQLLFKSAGLMFDAARRYIKVQHS